MTKEYSLPVPHILQYDCSSDTNVRCGAACVQMVLHDIDPNRPAIPQGQQTEQDNLFIQIQNPPPPPNIWHNPPQGINRVLNLEKPGGRRSGRAYDDLNIDIQAIFAPKPPDLATTYKFVILGNNSPVDDPDPGIPRSINVSNQVEQIELLSRLLIHTVAIQGAAPIVAVREDNAHWIVLIGFQIEDDYKDADLCQRGKIKSIIIRNPLGRYNYRDIECQELTDEEIQQITGHECELNSHVHDVVPYATWVREYLFADFAKTFVVISDFPTQVIGNILPQINCYASEICEKSASRKVVSLVFSQVGNWLVRIFRAICRIFHKPITPKKAKDRAARAIRDLNLSQLNQRVTPQNILEPVRIKRLDRIDGDYFLVPVGIREGERVRVSAFINISVTGEIDDAIVLPFTKKRESDEVKEKFPASPEQKAKTGKRDEDPAELIEHYVAAFDQHPRFNELISERNNRLIGRRIRLADGNVRTIKEVRRDTRFPYVWRPTPESSSASRPFHNLILTVVDEKGQNEQISFYPLIDDYCLPTDNGVISLPSANYLETVTKCIENSAGEMVDEVLVLINRRGTTALVKYKSNQVMDIDEEKREMRNIICQCLKAHPSAGLTHFRIKAFDTNAFLTRNRGGGEGGPLFSDPPSGGGDDSIPICSHP